MRAFINHFKFEFLTGLRDKTQLLMNYLFPLGFYVMMGLMMTKVNPIFYKTMIPAMIIFTILVGAILGMPNPLLAARELGIFRSYKINGVPAGSILSIPAISTIVHMTIVAIIITLTAPVFFKGELPVNWGYFILTFFAIVFACSGLGLLIGVFAENSRASILWTQLIFLPSMLLGGLMMPSSILPESLKYVGKLIPTTYAMSAFNGLAMNQPAAYNPWWSIGILFGGAIFAFTLATYLFKWDNQNSSKRSSALAALALLPYVAGAFLLK